MDIIVISRPDYFEGEAKLINQLFENGMGLLHIRKPEGNVWQFKELMGAINPMFWNKIAIHQHHELACDFNLSRLHYPEWHRLSTRDEVMEKQIHNGFTLSSSVHQLDSLPDLKFMEYVFYGPVFNSISKPGYEGVVAADFCLPPNRVGPKVIALGGITMALLPTVAQMNFDGAALLGAIWNLGATS